MYVQNKWTWEIAVSAIALTALGCGAATSAGSGTTPSTTAEAAERPEPEAVPAPAVANSAPSPDAAQDAPPAPQEAGAHLAKFSGTWTTDISWAAPEFPKPLAWKGQSELTMLGERWLLSHHTGEFMGMGFEARDVMGFDVRTQTWKSVWTDKVNDSMLVFEGRSEGEQPPTLVAQTLDDDGKTSWMRRQTEWKGPDAFILHFFAPGPDGSEREVMTIEAKRAPSGDVAAAP